MKPSLRTHFYSALLPATILVTISLVLGLISYLAVRSQTHGLETQVRLAVSADRLIRAIDEQMKETVDVVDGVDTVEKTGHAQLNAARATADQALAAWRKNLADLDDEASKTEEARLREVGEQYAKFTQSGDRVLALVAQGRPGQASQLIESELDLIKPASVRSNLGRYVDEKEARVAKDRGRLDGLIERTATGAWVTALLVLLSFAFMITGLTARVLKPIQEVESASHEISDGNLQIQVPVRSHDELGALAASFNHMAEELQQTRSKTMRASAEVRAARETAESASRGKSAVLAGMSQEIRASLNGVIVTTARALDTEIPIEHREPLVTAQRSAGRLLDILNDLLDFSNLEVGRLELNPGAFDPRAFAEGLYQTLAPRAQQKGLKLTCEVADDTPEEVAGDDARLRQVLLHLAGNAVQYTESGEVTFAIGVERLEPQSVEMRFEVSDTGLGIAADRQPLLWEPFARIEAPPVASTDLRDPWQNAPAPAGGIGLGLPIASRLVTLMGGRLKVESVPGQGSRFLFVLALPVSKHRTAPEDLAIQKLIGAAAVLVVDPDPANRRAVEHELVAWGARVTSEESGATAVATLESAARDARPFPLVFLDANLPDLDGFALAAEIRRRADLGHPDIVMLSSLHRPGDLARCREAGAALLLIKPVERVDLRAALSQILGEKRETPRLTASPIVGVEVVQTDATASTSMKRRRTDIEPATVSTVTTPLRVLVAEDNPVNQRYVARMLEKQGHQVTLANDGKDALQAIQGGDLDVVLVDMQLPSMSGLDIARRVRFQETGTGRHLAIIALTSRPTKANRELCQAAGMDGCISKPVKRPELESAIETAFDSAGGVHTTMVRTEGPVRGDFTGAAFDPDEMADRFDGDSRLMAEVLQTFEHEVGRRLDAIHRYYVEGDAPAIAQNAHSLKSMLATIAAGPATEIAQALEDAAHTERRDRIPDLVDRLERELDRLKVALRDYEPPSDNAANAA